MLSEILLYILMLIFPTKEDIYSKQFLIDTPYIPQYIYWIDDINVLLSSYGYTEIYNINTRKSNTIETCNECIYGYDHGFIYCRYEHREIQSMTDFSTTIYLYDIDENLLASKDIFPTVIPTICTRENIYLKNAYSFLEKKTYIFNSKKDSIQEYVYPKSNTIYLGLEDGYISISKRKDLEKLIVLESDYRLWVYEK